MHNEQRLIKEAVTGSAPAFSELVAPYLPQLQRWLRYMLDDENEDCLQEVLLNAWLKLSTMDEPAHFRGWLFRVARNKGLDYLRKKRRKRQVEIPLDLTTGLISRPTRDEPAYNWDELTGALTKAEREAIWLYYVDELSVKEIAQQRNVSIGAVKRLLHDGRNRIRITNTLVPEGVESMPTKHSLFLPDTRPTIIIQPSVDAPFEVVFREGPWYFTVLETGGKTQWAFYDPPDWQRTYVFNMKVTGRAFVHQEECWEVRGDEYKDGIWKENAFRHYVQLTDQYIKFLAVISYQDGVPRLDTFLNEHFQEDWGHKTRRVWKDEGRFLLNGDEVTTQDATKSEGAGYFSVTIGKKMFPCLRILETTWAVDDHGILVEAYLSREGRTVLFRRYNGKNWRQNSDWLREAEANQHLTLDGIEFIHWYDCISSYVIE